MTVGRAGRRTFRLKLTRAGQQHPRLLPRAGDRREGPARAHALRRAQARPCGATRAAARRPAAAAAAAGGGPAPPGEDISAPPANPKPLGPVNTANADRCDFLDPSVCLYPWPNNHFTTPDASKDTGRRLNLNLQSMPQQPQRRADRPDRPEPRRRLQPRQQDRDAGARASTARQAFEQTGAVPITDMARSFDADQPVVVINARTRQRHLIWAEVDSNPADKADRTLIIRPGKNFDEGERYIVALRRLRDETGKLLEPREEFRAYRDGITTLNPDIEARRAHYDGMFKTLGAAGIARKDLYLAWDFTVASERSLSERMLSIRDDAFGQAPLPGGLPPDGRWAGSATRTSRTCGSRAGLGRRR